MQKNISLRMQEDYEAYKKHFPWYRLHSKRRLLAFQAAIAAVPAAIILLAPMKKPIKAAIATPMSLLLWHKAKQKLPAKIQASYGSYLNSLHPENRYVFAPAFHKEPITDTDGTPIPVLEATLGDIPLAELMEPAISGAYSHAGNLKAEFAVRGGRV